MLFKHNFFVYYTLLTDLHSLSLTQTRELKIKITFPQINNQNFVVSVGQHKFLIQMSRGPKIYFDITGKKVIGW